jgi:ADP-ribose pyrophosphatase
MRISNDRILHQGPYLLLKERRYTDRCGDESTWTYAERVGTRRAAVVVATTRSNGDLIIIRQFRVPFATYVVEFPAGLIDDGESVAEAARRELVEETGYEGSVDYVGPAVASSAGLTTELVHLVEMTVDDEPARPTAHESSETIQVLTIPPAELAATLAEWQRDEVVVDAKLYTYLRTRLAVP